MKHLKVIAKSGKPTVLSEKKNDADEPDRE